MARVLGLVLRNLRALAAERSRHFGTGFSSLAYLRRFPVDQVKIDRSFLEGRTVDPRGEDLTVVRTIVDLGYVIARPTAPEGVHSYLESCLES